MNQANISEQNGADSAPEAKIPVWDRGVRAFHWLLVLTVGGAAATGFFGDADGIDFHAIMGAAIGLLLVFRLVWGFTGSTYSRFGSFAPSPARFMHHVRELLHGNAPHHTGHNPVGSAMIFALFVTLVAILGTGTAVLGGMVKEGPLAPFLSFATAAEIKEAHELLAFLLVGLVGLHIAGVLLESLRGREDLSRAMVTGLKSRREGAVEAASVSARPLAAAAVFLVLAGSAGAAITHFSLMPGSGVPDKPMDAAYAKECGSCHSAHHPSVAPAATWTAVMKGLDSHFGENASLDPALTARLTTYLTDNSAEKYDTWPANRFRVPSQEDPLRITATRGWKRTHHELPDEVFKAKAVGGKLNCSKCHRDAESGRFAPRAIHVP
jgi:cytochrome b